VLYGAEFPAAFCPRTHAFMSSSPGRPEHNASSLMRCGELPLRPEVSQKQARRRSPGITSFETTSKLRRDCSSVQKLIPVTAFPGSEVAGVIRI